MMNKDMFGNDLTKTDSFGTPRTTTATTYKWTNPQEWLQQYIDSLSYLELRQEAKNLASMLDSDQIQDTYQSDMDAQGYFKPEGGEDDDED